MSTKFTRLERRTPPSAPLTVLLHTAEAWVMAALLSRLRSRGFEDITEPHLNLLGSLDCGATHASAIAERMGISRQAIYRTGGEMQMLGYLTLETDPDRRNQKTVVMTDAGEVLVGEARAALADIEEILASRIGPEAVLTLRDALESEWGSPEA